MNKMLRLSMISAVIAASTITIAAPTTESVDSLPILKQESQHEAAAKRVSRTFTRAHYSDVVLDDALSVKIFDRFLRSLDANKNILLKSIDQFVLVLIRMLLDHN